MEKKFERERERERILREEDSQSRFHHSSLDCERIARTSSSSSITSIIDFPPLPSYSLCLRKDVLKVAGGRFEGSSRKGWERAFLSLSLSLLK